MRPAAVPLLVLTLQIPYCIMSASVYISTFQCKITNRTFGRWLCVQREDWVVLLGSAGSGVRLVKSGGLGNLELIRTHLVPQCVQGLLGKVHCRRIRLWAHLGTNG